MDDKAEPKTAFAEYHQFLQFYGSGTKNCSRHHVFVQSHALRNELNWQILIEGYLTLHILVQFQFDDLAKICRDFHKLSTTQEWQ